MRTTVVIGNDIEVRPLTDVINRVFENWSVRHETPPERRDELEHWFAALAGDLSIHTALGIGDAAFWAHAIASRCGCLEILVDPVPPAAETESFTGSEVLWSGCLVLLSGEGEARHQGWVYSEFRHAEIVESRLGRDELLTHEMPRIRDFLDQRGATGDYIPEAWAND
ncbi:MAG: hypothetical protein KIT79_01010 [Deltaproteobacteria bacterium]|nr:hypothetical protein [Deltaproteobacteria bacterium]